MPERFLPDVLDHGDLTADGSSERRRAAALAAAAAPAPSADEEEWRYSPIGDLDLDRFAPVTDRPSDTVVPVAGSDRGTAATITVVDGWVVSIDRHEGLPDGVEIVEADDRSAPGADADRFELLHHAFAPPALVVRVPDGVTVVDPIVVRSHHRGGGAASFGHVKVEAGADAEVSIVEYQTSADDSGLSVPRAELIVGDAGRLRYAIVQELGRELWQLARQRSEVGAQATIFGGVAAFGGAYARLRTDTRLRGRGSHGDLVSIYYGDGEQVHDFRTFQHHAAPDTSSDLLFKGAVDDDAGSIYTGLIHIHPEGRGSNAHQTNRNIKLSDDAWAWSVPNLEIENNEVRCSHASTVSPIDAEQQFYLQARGVPPMVADRLVVSGFFIDVLDRFADQELRAEVRRLVEAKLAARDRHAELAGASA